jgi:hypothetical protein
VRSEEDIRNALNQLTDREATDCEIHAMCDTLRWVLDTDRRYVSCAIGKDLPAPMRDNDVGLVYGHSAYTGRHVIHVPGRVWPYTPDICPISRYELEWINDHICVCQGCGLDYT